MDPMRTTAMPAYNPDPNRTTAFSQAEPSGPAVAIDVVPGRTATIANGPAREAFLVEIRGGGAATGMYGGRTAMDLCVLVDRSGSMEGPPLDAVKVAVARLVDTLSPQDSLSIVTFAETVEVLMPAQRVTQKEPIKQGIARLTAGNTTHLSGGLELARAQLAGPREGRRATRLIVLTDGEPTAGVTEFATLVDIAGTFREAGITMTFLGFGPDYNEELLAGMARRAGGTYAYVRSPEVVDEVFRAELSKITSSVARAMSLEVKLARWVTLRGPKVAMEGAITLDLADLERGAVLQQVLDFEFSNHPLGRYRVAEAILRYEDLTTGTTESRTLDLIMEFTADAARYGVPVDPRVAGAHEVAAASRAVEKTVMGLKTGALSTAAAVQDLQKTQALLLSQGRTDEARDVTMALRSLQSGDQGGAEKTLLGTALQLDQGKHSG